MPRLARSLTILLITLVVASRTLEGQTVPRRGFLRAFGEASVSVKPDMATVRASVITQGKTAEEASQLNASRATALFDRLKQAAGPAGEIRTVSYSVTPQYTYPREGGTPTLTGFTATNTVEVTIEDLNLTSRVIDTATEAGAARVDALRLGLKDDDPARAQALRAAAQKARTRVESIALGLGVRIGALISAEEGYVYRPLTSDERAAAPAAAISTPVEPGTLEIRATVTVEYETAP